MSEQALKRIAENKLTQNPELDLSDCDLASLPDQLEECTWLQSLNLNFNSELADFTLLAGLPQLQQLGCSETQISDLTPLAGLIQLQQLYCSETQIGDLMPLADLTQLQQLYCSGTQISDLTPLAGLIQLQQLACSGTQISDLIPLAGLIQLQQLDCSGTQISDLTPLAGLTQLQQLDCSGTQISDLTPLAGLTQLQQLDCSGTQISDLTSLASLTQLQQLGCSSTQISDLTPLAGLIQLQQLYCFETQISDLTPLAGLIQLQQLYCFVTQISDLTPLAGLTQLQQLDCSETQISDLAPLAGLIQLQQLDCSATQIDDLKPLTGLNNLKKLDAGSTEITDLWPILGLIQNRIDVSWNSDEFYENDSVICIEDCPLVCPPVEIARDSPQAVRDYFEELGDDGARLNEVKVIFLGEASAGKTSLVKRLMNEPFDDHESQTHGIRIRQANFEMSDGEQVAAHLWDFGGQEVMHATHQFFLSQRSVYVLLLNSRNDDQAEKWLKHADSFGGRSPVLVVLNKIDENPSFEVERKSLQEKYPRIQGFYRLSCAEAEHPGFIEFRKALRRQIEAADTRRTPFPKHWLAVKQHFVQIQQEYDYIESDAYRRVCEELGVTRPLSQDVLLQFLHDLGVLINFRNLQNFDTQILNPLWLTNGVYRIVNSALVADQGGVLREADFDAVINDPRYKQHNTGEREFVYPKAKLLYIVRVMQEFELCFPTGPGDFIVPQLLPASAPEFQADGALLRFVVHFPSFLPNSVFPRLMVKLHAFIRGGERWRTGMVLHKPSVFDALARVRWDKEDQKLLIDICGDERRRLLSFIRETIKEIVADFSGLAFEEWVPVPDCGAYKDYEELVEAEKAGETSIFVKELKTRVAIADLLDGVEEAAMRDEDLQLPVKAFVSYSHKDLAFVKTLQSALSPLVRLQKLSLWHDRDIDAGAEWRPEILQQLAQADIVLCLVSPDFVASDFCYLQEFEAALAAHRRGEQFVMPIRLRETDWQGLPLAEMQGAPEEWIGNAANPDQAWCRVSERLRPVIDKARERKRRKLREEGERLR
ncbi:leucine-rich repeat domain-containing protein [Methylomonas sp. UP202]|uniref:leucine-rich repeat domain-containing protein n=1 Tax=Methylomonas sp. UP202 TaxID=3040943 RepID=UPI0024784885|nr:leucine-rich repeat domain-containing protein [Methylomonas sp. UP202]WGS84750.1 leucine-rich repeat domain-containing protein [Methylomonas sp. UP202]